MKKRRPNFQFDGLEEDDAKLLHRFLEGADLVLVKTAKSVPPRSVH